MASKNKKSNHKKKNSMDGSRQSQLMKQKKSRNSTKSKTPRTPPKYNTKSSGKSSGSKSISIISSTSSQSTPKGTVLRFDQPVNNNIINSTNYNNTYTIFNTNNIHKTNKRSKSNPTSPQYNLNNLSKMNILYTQLKRKRKGNNHNNPPVIRPTFQFKIGMQVGVALGDCFLQLQKLENSMTKLRNVSEDITDVMQCIEAMGGTEQIKQNRKRSSSKGDKKIDLLDEIEDPIEEVHVLNDNLCKWQKDAAKRMKNVSVTVTKLQSKLENLDEYHSQAQAIQREMNNGNATEVDKAMELIENLKVQVQQTKMELSQKNLAMQRLTKSNSEPNNSQLLKDKLDKLETKEKELDRDAEIIATQSEELRKESERLLAERDEVRKQKENWQKMIDEVKEQKNKLEKRESELQANHKKLLELHETLSEEKKKLHKKAKKIKAREKRLNALRSAQSQYVQQQNQYQVPSSNGSDYAESELTYFSDGDTEIASVNSISDDESQDNYHKQQLKAIAHLGVPQNPMF